MPSGIKVILLALHLEIPPGSLGRGTIHGARDPTQVNHVQGSALPALLFIAPAWDPQFKSDNIFNTVFSIDWFTTCIHFWAIIYTNSGQRNYTLPKKLYVSYCVSYSGRGISSKCMLFISSAYIYLKYYLNTSQLSPCKELNFEMKFILEKVCLIYC